MMMETAANRKIEETLAKLSASVTVARAKEPPDQQPSATPMHGWSFLPSVTKAPLVPEALSRLRLKPPRFDGENAPDWINKIQTYYNHNYTPLDDRLYLTQYLFDPPASDWMEYWVENNKGKGWDDFLLALKQRFDPDLYDYVGRLATLRQTSTVESYQASFESLLQKASHIGDATLSSLFIAGLKSPLKQLVLMRRPRTLEETLAIAQKLDQRKPNRKTACLVANQELDHQPPQRKEEVTQVSVNQSGVLPVTVTVSSNNFAIGSSSNSIICDECMSVNTLSVDSVTKEHNGCNRDCISVDINVIDDSLIDQACSKALNINNGVIVTDDIEEQPTQVQALAETDFCTEFLDAVNPQSEVLADSQPLLSRISTAVTNKQSLLRVTSAAVAAPNTRKSRESAVNSVGYACKSRLGHEVSLSCSGRDPRAFWRHSDIDVTWPMSSTLSTASTRWGRELLQFGEKKGVCVFDPGDFESTSTLRRSHSCSYWSDSRGFIRKLVALKGVDALVREVASTKDGSENVVDDYPETIVDGYFVDATIVKQFGWKEILIGYNDSYDGRELVSYFGAMKGVRIFDPGDFESTFTLDETLVLLFHHPP